MLFSLLKPQAKINKIIIVKQYKMINNIIFLGVLVAISKIAQVVFLYLALKETIPALGIFISYIKGDLEKHVIPDTSEKIIIYWTLFFGIALF